MYKYITAIFFTFYFQNQLYGQVMPAEGSSLNYRIIGFKFTSAPYAHNCNIEIANGNCKTEDSFKQKIIISQPIEDNKIITEVPAFGAAYTWRYSYSVNGTKIYSALHHFSTKTAMVVDTNLMRLRIMQPAVKYKDAFVFMDGNRVMYDMNGNPVWYLSNVKWRNDEKELRDLKVSSHNTITYIYRDIPTEINYNEGVLWKGPNDGKVSGDKTEQYHHEFTRLENGHYMVLGTETNWKYPSPKDSLYDGDAYRPGYDPVEFGTIIEYDEGGNVIWSWKSSKYFLEEDPNYIKPLKRHYPVDYGFNRPNQHDVHENAFFFDEKNKVIYVSFREMNQIIKLKYPTGNILNTYGPMMQHDGKVDANIFCHQHCCRISKDGYLYLFNNNLCALAPAKISIWQEPVNKGDTLKKIWEYQCTVEDNNDARFPTGGSVEELVDGSMFVSMGSAYSKVFIVNRNKDVLWSALPQRWDADTKKWCIVQQYRSSIITREELEKLIWNSEETKY